MGAQETTEFKTRDMSLVAYLAVRGRSDYRLERDGGTAGRPKAIWIFPDIGDLIGIVDEFYDDDARVEPREFNKSIRRVRDELYDFLGIGRRRNAAA